VQVSVPVQVEAVDDREPGLGTFGLGDGDGPAQLDHRRAGQDRELAVECGDLRPVRLVGVQRGMYFIVPLLTDRSP